MSKLGLSKNSTLTLGGIFKNKAKGAIPNHLGAKLDAILSRLEDYFCVEQHDFNVKPSKDSAEKTGRKKKELVPEKRFVVRVTEMKSLLEYLELNFFLVCPNRDPQSIAKKTVFL